MAGTSKDYARMYSGRNRRQSGSRMQYLLAGLLLLSLAAGILYFVRHHPAGFLKDRPALRDRLYLSGDSANTVNAAEKPAEDAASPVAFDFYNTLPATSSGAVNATAHEDALPPVTYEKIAAGRSQPAPSVKGAKTPKAHYVLQLGVFADRKAAARTRLNFLLAGVDSIIVRETSEGGKILFRIQQGSYLTEKAALTAGSKFRRHGVTAIVRKVVDIDATVPT